MLCVSQMTLLLFCVVVTVVVAAAAAAAVASAVPAAVQCSHVFYCLVIRTVVYKSKQMRQTTVRSFCLRIE